MKLLTEHSQPPVADPKEIEIHKLHEFKIFFSKESTKEVKGVITRFKVKKRLRTQKN